MKFTLSLFAAFVLPLASEAARLNEPEVKKVRDLAENLKDLDLTDLDIVDAIRALEDAGDTKPKCEYIRNAKLNMTEDASFCSSHYCFLLRRDY